MRTLAKVPLRKGEVDQDFDQEELAALLDQGPFNAAVADLYRVRFKHLPGIVYSAGVKHAHNVAKAFKDAGMKAEAVSGETPKRELARILAAFERGEIDVLVNAMLLAEGWNSPRATVCMHLAPTASKRVYQQRVGRVTRRHPGKEAGIVVDFVHPATTHDEPIVTLHKLLDRDVYRGGAIVVGPVRRGRGRRLRVERRIVPVTSDPERRLRVFERELWRIAVEYLYPDEQHAWAALAGARVAANGWRRAKTTIHHDAGGELRRRFLLSCIQRNRNAQLRQRALAEIAVRRDAEGFDLAVDIVGTWSREERREGARILLQALAERRIGRRDQAQAWLWRLAEYSREVHEEYAVQRWPETKRLLGLLVNSSGPAHGRNARRLVHAARKHDRRLAAALLASAVAHTPEAEEVLRGARNRMARKPSALARELVRNFPKGKRRGKKQRDDRGDASRRAAARAANGKAEIAEDLPPDELDELEVGDSEAAERPRANVRIGDRADPDCRRSKPRRAQRSRWTSPASRRTALAVVGEHDQGAVVVDARAPRPTCARRPAVHVMSLAVERVALAEGGDHALGCRSAVEPVGEPLEQRRPAPARGRPGRPSRCAARSRSRAARGSSSSSAVSTFSPIPSDRPALLRPRLDQDARDLAARRSRRRWAI